MKKNIQSICILLFSLLLAACAQSDTSKLDPKKTTYSGSTEDIAITENGVYYTDTYATPYPLLMFYDFKSGKAAPLCSNPQCSHDNLDICNATFKYGVKGHFYNSEKDGLQALSIIDSTVYSIKTDGSGRDVIGDLGLISAGNSGVHFTGTYMISNKTMSFTSFTKDGSAVLYYLPLYKNASPQKLYEAASSTIDDYPLIVRIWADAICEDIIVFHEVSLLSLPDGITAEEVGRPVYLSALKYISADMDEPVTVAENYDDITTYGEQYLISGDAGFAIWDPSTNRVESIELPQKVMDAYEQAETVYSIDYDATDSTYYVVIQTANASDTSGVERTIFVLDSQLKLKNTIYLNDFDYKYLGQTSDSIVAVGQEHGENVICILPKSELENQTEITWGLENVLE